MTTYNVNGVSMTESDMHDSQTPSEVLRDCEARMGSIGSSRQDAERLRRRWPMLSDCLSAMSDAYGRLTPEEQADDAAEAQRALDFALSM